MPLRLRPPRPNKTPNYEIRGTYRKVHVETSSGTHRRSDALGELRRIEGVIDEFGQYPAPESKPDPGQPNFLNAAVAYMQAGGERRYIAKLIKHFRSVTLAEIDQDAIDKAADALYPMGAPDYRNRAVHTPVSAILHHALGDKCPQFKRPKGSKGRNKTDFMWPADAFAVIEAADNIDGEFGLYLRFLIYTGIRKGEGLKLLSADVQPGERAAWLRDSKNEDPRMLKLREDIVAPLEAHLEANSGERLFRFRDGGHFKHLLLRAKLSVCGMDCPKRRPTGWKPQPYRLAFVGFHTFRHTWATWMRRYGGADVQGLVATKNWRDPRSAARYSHVVAREDWDRVDNLPTMGKNRGKAANE